MWLSRVLACIRAKRAPISAPMPTSATPRTQGGRPPSIRPAPCSTLEPIIAPNIQLAGNLISRSSSATATEAAISSASSSGEAIATADGRRRRRRHPGQRQQHRQRRGEDDHAHGLHHGDRRHVGALLGGEHGDLRQRAGAAGQKRRGPVPAMDALQIKAGAEGRAEGRERQQRRWSADRRSMCCNNCRDTSEPSEMPSSTSTVWVRIGGMASGRPAMAAMPTAIIAPEISPPGRCAHKNSSAAGGADGERFEHVEDFGAAGNGGGHRCGDQAHAALWQIRARGTNAPARCSNARSRRRWSAGVMATQGATGRSSGRSSAGQLRLVGGGLLALGAEFLALLAVESLGVGFLRAFERGGGARLLGLLFRRRLGSVLVASVLAGAVVCANAAPISSREATAVAVAREEIFVMGAPRIENKAATVAPQC